MQAKRAEASSGRRSQGGKGLPKRAGAVPMRRVFGPADRTRTMTGREMADSGGTGNDEGSESSAVEYEELEELEEEKDELSNTENLIHLEDGDWDTVRRGKKRKTRENKGDEGKPNEIKVIIRFQTPGALNPLKISDAVYKLVGEVHAVRTLRDGNLMIVCRDKDQQVGLMRCKTLMGKNVIPQIWEERGRVMGVISSVPTDLTEEEIKTNVRGAQVNKVKRLTYTRDGVKGPSLSVMISFDEDRLPERVKVGYVSYAVRPYIPPPTRCFKCQRFGHIAVACRAKNRCAKCGGDHEYGNCGEGTKIKCCNCGGEHSAAYKGCIAHKRAIQVQNVKV